MVSHFVGGHHGPITNMEVLGEGCGISGIQEDIQQQQQRGEFGSTSTSSPYFLTASNDGMICVWDARKSSSIRSDVAESRNGPLVQRWRAHHDAVVGITTPQLILPKTPSMSSSSSASLYNTDDAQNSMSSCVMVYSGSCDGTVCAWDASRLVFYDQQSDVSSAASQTESKCALSSSSSNAAISQTSFLTSAASLFPSDPDTRSTARSKSAKIPSTPSGGPILSTEKDMDDKVLLAEENVLVSGLSPKHQQKPQREFACGAPLAFLSACGSHVASATWTNTIHLWNLDKESS